MEKTLSLTFTLGNGKNASLSIKEPKFNLTEQEVKSAISTIIDQQAFARNGEVFTSIKSAKLIERYVTNYEV